jgi:hypothetical protein
LENRGPVFATEALLKLKALTLSLTSPYPFVQASD